MAECGNLERQIQEKVQEAFAITKKRKILVEVGYKDFVFEDITKALLFADMAYASNKDESDEVKITIRYEEDENV